MTAAELTVEQRARLAEYRVLLAYDLKRCGRYGDMARSRRGREIDRMGDGLIHAGVRLERRDGILDFPVSTPAELVAAFERVGLPRLRRLERETATVELSFGGTYNLRTKYNGTSLDTWQELERELRGMLHAEASA